MTTQFVTNNMGKTTAVILPIKEYNKMIEKLEEIEDIRLYDEAKASNEPSYPIDEAFEMIEKARKKRKNGV